MPPGHSGLNGYQRSPGGDPKGFLPPISFTFFPECLWLGMESTLCPRAVPASPEWPWPDSHSLTADECRPLMRARAWLSGGRGGSPVYVRLLTSLRKENRFRFQQAYESHFLGCLEYCQSSWPQPFTHPFPANSSQPCSFLSKALLLGSPIPENVGNSKSAHVQLG